MPYQWYEPEIAVQIDGEAIYYAYKKDPMGDKKLGYWFADHPERAESDGCHFDIRDQPVYRELSKEDGLLAELDEDKIIKYALVLIILLQHDIVYK